jgi:26S proteasome non-ATPase regulatory subunit 9
MNFMTSGDSGTGGSIQQLREAVKLLMAQRDALEAEADAIHSELTSPGPNSEPPAGLKTSFIDNEGFPRGDIDIINAKNKRRRLAEINTDHKDIMRRIEQAMARLHQVLPEVPVQKASGDDSTARVEEAPAIASSIEGSSPMAKLDEVLPNSPAALAGINNGDLLMKFDTITSATGSFLTAIAQLVGQRVNQEIPVTVRRGTQELELTLVPKPWGGRGLLGCHLSPIQQ